jgi:hypothetical protein
METKINHPNIHNNNNNNNNNNINIIIRDNEKGTCMLIDAAISGDRNVIKKKPRRF